MEHGEKLINRVTSILSDANSPHALKTKARQVLFLTTPLSKVVETMLYDNEGHMQNLDKFRMMRQIYDALPQKLLLKCSRKTLKSTLLSNMIVINMLRYNYYNMLYVAPLELSAKRFSNDYLNPRFESIPVKKIIDKFDKYDVFVKKINCTNSSVQLGYCSTDASRLRGPSCQELILDELQDICYDEIPIIQEVLTLLPEKRELYAGTPLTTDNTIHTIWLGAHQLEWMTKCTRCNHWNSLTDGNEPLKMILEQGLSCSKCSNLLNTDTGQWIDFNPGKRAFYGYHIAQPILTYFNQNPREWKAVYEKVTDGKYSIGKVYNEVFGLAYDIGTKPISEETLKKLCVLGEMDTVLPRNRHKYVVSHVIAADWGVNMQTSRTAVCAGGLREDGVFEVFFLKIYHDFDYNSQIRDIAARANQWQCVCACDSGPDPNRGIMLAEMTSWQRTQLVRYERGKLIQRYDVPPNSVHPSQNRWCLHRSDTMTFTFNELKAGRILFPRWEDSGEALMDLLNVNIEVREGELRQEIIYSHPPLKPDDFMHALNYALCQAHMLGQNQLLNSVSSTGADSEWSGGSLG